MPLVDVLSALLQIRSDPGVVVPADDSALVGCVLRWLLASADRAPRALAVPLRRYLRALAQAAHHTAALHSQWAASRARARDELAAMAAFCRLVDSGHTPPMQGNMHRCTYTPCSRDFECRWTAIVYVRCPGGRRQGLGVGSLAAPSVRQATRWGARRAGTLPRAGAALLSARRLPADAVAAAGAGAGAGAEHGHLALHLAQQGILHEQHQHPALHHDAVRRQGVPRRHRGRCVLITGLPGSAWQVLHEVVWQLDLCPGVGAVDVSLPAEDECWEPLHGRLRQSSPLTALLLQRHRHGLHRAIGDLLPALLALHKFSVSIPSVIHY